MTVKLMNGSVTLDQGWATYEAVHQIKIGYMALLHAATKHAPNAPSALPASSVPHFSQPKSLQSPPGAATTQELPPAMFLEQVPAHLRGERRWGDGVMRDLDISMRDQGPVRSVDDTLFQRCSLVASVARIASGAASGVGGGLLALWFATGQVQKLLGVPRPPGILMLGYGCGCFSLYMKMQYYDLQKDFAAIVLEHGEEHTKRELAKIILNNHSTDKSLVEVLKRHYVADHLLSDEHQEKQLFRWRQRHLYVDSAFMERLKEELIEVVKKKVIERVEKSKANNADGEAESSANVGLFEEDPLACVLGTPDSNRKMNMLHTGTILTRRELLIEEVTGSIISDILKTAPISDMLEIAAL
ncbi:uncharacterized protein [Triticum aestivum]|uniref:uncharacterized protein n=1 Tax=Triticum aestivum TaxID=4565 RepID=UPI001D02A89F|nr:uncharacterized protein LOC123129490 [Triticum aestivum]